MASEDQRIVPRRDLVQRRPAPIVQRRPTPMKLAKDGRQGNPIFKIDPSPLPGNRPVVKDRTEDLNTLMGYID